MSNTRIKANHVAPIIHSPIILAVDTSSTESSLSVSRGESIIVTLNVRNDRPHSQVLFSQLSAVLKLAEKNIQDVSAFAVSAGPGSFTGLRVGLAAVKGLADSLEKPCLGLDSLDLHALASGIDGAHLVMIDAGRSEVYCGFREVSSGDIVLRSVKDCVGDPISVLRPLMLYVSQPILNIIGDGGYRYREEIAASIRELEKNRGEFDGVKQLVFIRPLRCISAALACSAARLIRLNQTPPVKPHYIRKSDAELKWK